MIIRRFASAIRSQDWVVVCIEFLLVFAGVVIALQFDNWNTVNRNQVALTEMLDRLEAELDLNDQLIESMLNRIGDGDDQRAKAFEALETCDDSPEFTRTLNAVLQELTGDFSPLLASTTLEQLNRRDPILELLSSEFRLEIGVYTNAILEEQHQLAFNAGLRWDQHVIKHPHVTANLGNYDDPSAITLAVPVSTACEDPAFRRQFFVTAVFLDSTRVRLTAFKGKMDAFREALEAEVERRS